MGIVDMCAYRLQERRLTPGGNIIAACVVLVAFGLFVLDLPVHLVHHLGDVNPDCQLLGLSVALTAAGLIDTSNSPSVDSRWDVVLSPLSLSSHAGLWESFQARAPPPVVQS
jgi:hypothetical protein